MGVIVPRCLPVRDRTQTGRGQGDSAAQLGMEAVGLDYSGEYGGEEQNRKEGEHVGRPHLARILERPGIGRVQQRRREAGQTAEVAAGE